MRMAGEVGYHTGHVEVVRGAQFQHEVTTSFGFLLGNPPHSSGARQYERIGGPIPPLTGLG